MDVAELVPVDVTEVVTEDVTDVVPVVVADVVVDVVAEVVAVVLGNGVVDGVEVAVEVAVVYAHSLNAVPTWSVIARLRYAALLAQSAALPPFKKPPRAQTTEPLLAFRDSPWIAALSPSSATSSAQADRSTSACRPFTVAQLKLT